MTDMNDDSSPELEPGLAAASAHFDGMADADERALVEASPELQAVVASFAQVKAALNDVPPVPATELDDVLDAALAEFDALQRSDTAPAAAAAFSMRAPARTDRARWSRVLTVAAAAAVIGVVGVAVAKNVGTSHRSSASTAGEKIAGASTIAAGTAAAPSATNAVAGGLAASSTIGAINAPADALPAYDQPSDLLTLPGSTQDATATAESGAPAVPAAAGNPGTNGVPLTGPVVFPFTCPLTADQVFIAEISWKGTPAAAVRNTVKNVTQAIDQQCNVLASAP